MMTEKDSLVYGIEYPADSGQFHYDFEVRLPVIRDNVEAIQSHGTSAININVAMMAACLVRIGDIPRKAITFELLDGGLDPEDYDTIDTAWDALKKKRMRPSSSSSATDLPSPSSAVTGSTNPASAA